MNPILEKLGYIGVIPVVRIDDPDTAEPLAAALEAGGIPCMEITFRTKHGEEAIRRISRKHPNMVVGAGTVLTAEQAGLAINAGASFIVSPGLNPAVVESCLEKGVPITPGCATPSDMEKAMSYGLDVVKFFPAEQAGGIDYLKAVSAPYTGLRFIPTGGIGPSNLKSYLKFDKILACGGSWMVKPELVNAGKFDEVTSLSKQAVEAMLDFSLAHIGINADTDAFAAEIASSFENMFGFAAKDGGTSIFAGTGVEVIKTGGLGEKGHIGIATANIDRAIWRLENRGFKFIPETLKKSPAGKTTIVYFENPIGGFALHLLQK